MTVEAFAAMGTMFEVHAEHDGDHEAVRKLVENHEARFSRFLATSELSHLNDSAAEVATVSHDMRSMLESARRAYSLTGGLVDIGIGQAVRMWGYDRTFGDMTGPSQTPTGHTPSDWRLEGQHIILGQGTKLDLGGIAKGWTCDRAVEAGLATMVSAGGDLRSADPTLVVEIVDHKGHEVDEVSVGVGALATSSRMKRRWVLDSGEAHHLIDPRTMRPSITPITSASVVAETAVEAEAGAKAVLLLGDDGLAWADRQPWIRQAIAVWHDGSVYATKPRQAA